MPTTAVPTTALPTCLLPELLELERKLPEDAAAFFARAADSSAAPAPSSRAALEVLRYAAQAGLEPAELGMQLRAAGLGEEAASFFANYWALQPPRSALQRSAPLQLVDVDWNFGVSASSSEHAAMGTTFVQLRLNARGQKGSEYVHTGKSCCDAHASVRASACASASVTACLPAQCSPLPHNPKMCRARHASLLRLPPPAGAGEGAAGHRVRTCACSSVHQHALPIS